MIKPFLKWVGGKRQLLPEIKRLLPKDFYEYDQYFEPFIGGGSVLFSLRPDNAYISDVNRDLMLTYFCISHYHEDVISRIKSMKNTKEEFYKTRDLYNTGRKAHTLTAVEIAAMFIYLNKTGFNGMYRVNGKGDMNTPWNHNPHEDMRWFIDEEDIEDTSKYLREHVFISVAAVPYYAVWAGYREKLAGRRVFWYLDPPYAPLDKDIERGNFTEYASSTDDWAYEEQVRLRDMCNEIDKAGQKFMLSNSSCKLIKDLYKDFNIEEVDARRMISSKASTRGGCKEVIVTNY